MNPAFQFLAGAIRYLAAQCGIGVVERDAVIVSHVLGTSAMPLAGLEDGRQRGEL